jgi:hypothetical protein
VKGELMNIKTKSEHYVYCIVDNETNKIVPCYFQFSGDKYNFNSIEEARESNCHGIFKDKDRYRIAKFKVTEELQCDNCDPITFEEQVKIDKSKLVEERINKFYQESIRKYDFDKMNDLDVINIKSKKWLWATMRVIMEN